MFGTVFTRKGSINNLRSGLTLVELLTVLGVIGLLVAMSLPAVHRIREAARRTHCSNTMRQLAVAMSGYEASNGTLPSALSTDEPYRWTTWMMKLTPYLDEKAVFDRIITDYDSGVSPFFDHALREKSLKVFACPSDPESGVPHVTHGGRVVGSTNYLGVSGTDYLSKDGVLYLNSKTDLPDVLDGLNNTIMIGERPPSSDYWYGWWYSGSGQAKTGSADNHLGVKELKYNGSIYLDGCSSGPYYFQPGKRSQCDTLHFWSHHSGGAYFARVDNSIGFHSYDSKDVLHKLATRRDGETEGL